MIIYQPSKQNLENAGNKNMSLAALWSRSKVFIIILLSMIACKKGPPDGNYCAKVQFLHHERNKFSTLNLIAEVKNNQLIGLSFPEGHTDTSSIKPVNIPQDGKFTAVSVKGTVYKVQMIGGADKCVKAHNMVQCKGLSKDGVRCKRFTDSKNGLCWQHKNQRIR
jgi:hypothetical protein